jgi:hypothetical protein
VTVDKYLGRQYRPGTYNCLHFATDVWRDLTGQDIRASLDGLLQGALDGRVLRGVHVRAFRRLAGPLDPCLVLFQAPKAAPHIGVYMRGKVLHIGSQAGVRFVPVQVAALGFPQTTFIQPL